MKHNSNKVNAEQLESMDRIRELANALDQLLDAVCPKSREQSLAMTKLEECSMWAIKAITHN